MTSTSTIHFRKKMFSCKTSFLVFMLTVCCGSVFSQFRLHIDLRQRPSSHINDSIFVAGNFNGWNPGDSGFRLIKHGETYSMDIRNLAADVYQFKFTRGHWGKSETTADGKTLANRLVKLESDTSLQFEVEGWADDFAAVEKHHTASSNVSVLDSAFFIPQLGRTRKIWIYLPPGYNTTKKKYPVLYMHDGQNLFDDYTSAYGEWGVDEWLDSLIETGKPASIVVGIENGAKRMIEYNPDDNSEFGIGEGKQYAEFIANTLKPFIDAHYRTLASRENTFVAGSSMGGLISYYCMLQYPAVFGKAGVFSPAFWTAPHIMELTDSLSGNMKGQFFFFAGELEGGSMVPDMEKIADKLGSDSHSLIYAVVDPAGRHNEPTWRKWFGEFYLWIMGNGLSYQIKTQD